MNAHPMNDKPIDLVIDSEFHSPDELHRALQASLPGGDAELTLKMADEPSAFRMDPTIVAALIAAGASIVVGGVSALATVAVGLLALVPSARSSVADASSAVPAPPAEIAVKLGDGREFRFPAGTTAEEIDRVIQATDRRHVCRIELREAI